MNKAKYTAVISDLHLCEAEPEHKKYPLWKKYKTKQFFFDDKFGDFLKFIEKSANGEPIELILNGDIFDFDSVTTIPDYPPYAVTWLERRSGLHAQEDKSLYKIRRILDHHKEWVEHLRDFILRGHKAVFIIGNHDMELHWPVVKDEVVNTLDLPAEHENSIRFNSWFYISNEDTLIEHGNQYDPYCLAFDPINPFIERFNRVEVRVPFGNLTTRYLINSMPFFNPHLESNFLMSGPEYVKFFFKYVIRAQPFLIVAWLLGSTITLWQSFVDRLRPSFKNPLMMESQIEEIAKNANTTPRVVRELRELFVAPASSYPLIILRELWLDRAFLAMLFLLICFQFFLFINNVYKISFFWLLIPITAFMPFFIFYSKSIVSGVIAYKEPKEKTLWTASLITKVNRIVFGHTHEPRHELIGPVEYLNSGTWSPAFKDVECEQPIDLNTFVWIEPNGNSRRASVRQFINNQSKELKSLKQSKKLF